MKFFLIAGERSGDLHGSNLIKALRHQAPDSAFEGMGGDAMQDAGARIVVHYRHLAFMGILQVLANLGKVRKAMAVCRQAIRSSKPDAVVLIDYGGFNMRMARWCRANGYRVFYFISPKVWAWNTGRAKKLKATVDRMFCILPFETAFYRKFNWEVDYVGNPVLDAIKNFSPDPAFPSRNGLAGQPFVALLPGSRKGEVQRILPVLAQAIRLSPDIRFEVAAIRELPEEIYTPLKDIPNVHFVWEETYNLLCHARAAVVTSGTATLETAIFGVPQVVVYKASTIEYAIGRRLIRVPHISLVNLIAEREVVQELLQEKATAESIAAEVKRLISDGPYRTEMLRSGYGEIRHRIDTGSASENTARLMIADLKNQTRK